MLEFPPAFTDYLISSCLAFIKRLKRLRSSIFVDQSPKVIYRPIYPLQYLQPRLLFWWPQLVYSGIWVEAYRSLDNHSYLFETVFLGSSSVRSSTWSATATLSPWVLTFVQPSINVLSTCWVTALWLSWITVALDFAKLFIQYGNRIGGTSFLVAV